jgi:hypothetical protein
LVSEFSLLFTVRHATISRLKIKSFLKFDTALHVSAYSAIIRCVETEGNCCAFRAPAIRVFVFTVFLNEVNVLLVSPVMCNAKLCVSFASGTFKLYIVKAGKCVYFPVRTWRLPKNVVLWRILNLDIVAWWTVNKTENSAYILSRICI